jgi:phytoene dehydrogenase-like protein
MATTKMGKPTMKPGMSTAKDGMKKATPMANTMMAGAGMKSGGGVKKMASGGFVRSADGIASKGKTKAKQITMCGGGMAKRK